MHELMYADAVRERQRRLSDPDTQARWGAAAELAAERRARRSGPGSGRPPGGRRRWRLAPGAARPAAAEGGC